MEPAFRKRISRAKVVVVPRPETLKKTLLLVGQQFWYRSRMGDLGHDLPVGVFLELKNDAASRLGMPGAHRHA